MDVASAANMKKTSNNNVPRFNRDGSELDIDLMIICRPRAALKTLKALKSRKIRNILIIRSIVGLITTDSPRLSIAMPIKLTITTVKSNLFQPFAKKREAPNA